MINGQSVGNVWCVVGVLQEEHVRCGCWVAVCYKRSVWGVCGV